MRNENTVELYFDFVSPYAYLALTQVASFGEHHDVRWDLRPVVYGALLDATGLVGPAEVEAKRRYTFHDVARTAASLGVPLVGPPAHPFRSLEALRTVCAYGGRSETLELTVALARACWGEGRDLTDVDVLRDVVGRVGLDDGDLRGRIVAPETKESLRRSTEAALAAGVFGVPTFRLDQELFWGHDRMDQLGARLKGVERIVDADVAALEQRPRGADRRAARLRPDKPGE